ncbi:hypothetical protein [Reinekea sp. G2M2-21]|uniref:hypothetical protein n=1 Tax=Reinekea sp. G2M2-21 TaxID=2788942 RepID=UPI0018AA9587|nr:hypothetical protein [Reinekea sp. G2M2-21]
MKYIITLFLAVFSTAASAADLRILVWDQNNNPATFNMIRNNSGLKISVDVYSTSEEAFTAIDSKQYDLIIGSAEHMAALQQDYEFAELNRNRAFGSEAGNIMDRNEQMGLDPVFFLPFARRTVGLLFDRSSVNRLVSEGVPSDPFALAFDDLFVSRVDICGISSFSDPMDFVAIWSSYHGVGQIGFEDVGSASNFAFKKNLSKITSRWSMLNSGEYHKQASLNRACVVLGQSGELLKSMEDLSGNGNFVLIGTASNMPIFTDVIAVPGDQVSPEVYRLLEAIYLPETQGMIANESGLMPINRKASEFVKGALIDERLVFPELNGASLNYLELPSEFVMKRIIRSWYQMSCSAQKDCTVPISLSPGWPISAYYRAH